MACNLASGLRLMAAFLVAVTIGYSCGTVAWAQEEAEVQETETLDYRGATDGQQMKTIEDPNDPGEYIEVPILDASYTQGSPSKVFITIPFGEIGYESQDWATAKDNLRLDGWVNDPQSSDIRWQVEVLIDHGLLANIDNGPGDLNQGWYLAKALGQSEVHFQILTAGGSLVREIENNVAKFEANKTDPAVGPDSKAETHEFNQVNPEDENDPPIPYVLGTDDDSDKARLSVKIYGSVYLYAYRPEVEVGGSAEIEISGTVAAYDYGTDPDNPMLLKKDVVGNVDAVWELE